MGAPVTVVTEAGGPGLRVDYGAGEVRAPEAQDAPRAHVTFGRASAGEVPVDADGALQVALPEGLALGAHDVHVRWEDGREAVLAGGFELLPAVPRAPRLTGLVLGAPGPQRKGVPFALELRVEGPDAEAFDGEVALRASKGRVVPARVGPFRAGVWRGPVLLDASHPAMVLSASDAWGHTARTPPFPVTPR